MLLEDGLSALEREYGIGVVCECECECAASKLNLRPWIGPDTSAPASQIVLCSSAKCCCDKSIITMTSRLPSEMKGA